jgi:hypothetical protein
MEELEKNFGQEGLQEDSLEKLLQNKSSRLQTHLEVISTEIHHRFQIRDRNLGRIEVDKLAVTNLLLHFDPNYGVGVARDPGLNSSLYRGYFDLNRELRQQEVDCWRDVAHVMREFLVAWDSYQEAKSRASFLKIR